MDASLDLPLHLSAGGTLSDPGGGGNRLECYASTPCRKGTAKDAPDEEKREMIAIQKAISVGDVDRMHESATKDIVSLLDDIEWSKQPRPCVQGDSFGLGATQDYKTIAKVGIPCSGAQRRAIVAIDQHLCDLNLVGFE